MANMKFPFISNDVWLDITSAKAVKDPVDNKTGELPVPEPEPRLGEIWIGACKGYVHAGQVHRFTEGEEGQREAERFMVELNARGIDYASWHSPDRFEFLVKIGRLPILASKPARPKIPAITEFEINQPDAWL